MTEYILKIEESKQSTMLVKYLKSLDFVVVEAKRNMNPNIAKRKNTIKPKQEDDFIKFLDSLPEVEYNEQEVNNAIAEMRKTK
jgi:hypothetical protein